MAEDQNRLAESYERFAEKTKEFLDKSQEKTTQSLEAAMENARSSLEKAEEFSHEEGQKLKAFLKRDLEQTARDVKTLETYTVEHLRPTSMRAGFYNLVSSVAHGSTGLFERLAEWADQEVTVHTGEITGPATLRCSACDETLHFKESGRVPPCPKCHKTDYRRTS